MWPQVIPTTSKNGLSDPMCFHFVPHLHLCLVQSTSDQIRQMLIPGGNEVLVWHITPVKPHRNQAFIKTACQTLKYFTSMNKQTQTAHLSHSHKHQHMQTVGRLMWVFISKYIPPSHGSIQLCSALYAIRLLRGVKCHAVCPPSPW